MKKHLLLSLIAAFMVVLGASAQGNSYNMVIEMANGTKINIGPNDIKNISFIDGNLTVSGESIDDIKKDISDIKNAMANLKTCQCSGEIAALKKEVADLNIPDIVAMINVLQMQIKSLMDEIDALKKNGGENNNQGNDDNQGGNNNQGGNDNNQIDPALVGVWYCVVYEGTSYFTIGWRFDANGDCYYDEWGNKRNEAEWGDLPAKWYASNNILTTDWTDEEGTEIEIYSYSLSNNNTTLTLTSKRGNITHVFTKQ